MAKLHAFIRKYGSTGQGMVILEYSHLKKRCRISTGIDVKLADITCVYDDDVQQFKLSALRRLTETQRERLAEKNRNLQRTFSELSASLSELQKAGQEVNRDNLQSLSNRVNTSTPKQQSVMEWYGDFIRSKVREIGSGINGYRSTFEHFKVFTQEHPVITFADFSRNFVEGFRDYLVGLRLSGPTIHKQFRNLRIFVTWVQNQYETESITMPKALKKAGVKARYGEPIGLTIDQFFQFYTCDLSQRRHLEVTRDLFVFAVSIGGPRHGDLQRLGENLRRHGFSVNNNALYYFEGKTGNAHTEIVLNKIGIDILRKYEFAMPKVPSNFRMNTNLKSIARILEWKEIKYVPRYNAFGKIEKVEEVPLMNLFSTKFMRKTAATIDNYLGVPIKTSMSRTGHRTFAAFSRYVDVNRESLDQANRQWDKIFDKAFKKKVDGIDSRELEFQA